MILVSQIIKLACWFGGPRFSHQVYLRRLERWRNFEPEYFLLDHLVDRTRAAVDIGANEGIYAGRLAQLCQRVHCFEPIPWFAAALREKLPTTVIVHECALSNRNGDAELRIPYAGDVEMHGTSTLEQDNPLPGSTRVRTIPCQVRRFDDVVDEPVGFLKIDVEGHELAVLEGAERTLRQHRPIVLFESEKRHSAAAPESVFRFLEARGYSGLFLLGGRPTVLAAFQPDIHQRVENLARMDHSYIHNFIFLPGPA
jgi:FkbM family methyltransferase